MNLDKTEKMIRIIEFCSIFKILKKKISAIDNDFRIDWFSTVTWSYQFYIDMIICRGIQTVFLT